MPDVRRAWKTRLVWVFDHGLEVFPIACLSINRLDALRRNDKLTLEETRVLAKVLAWLPSTTTGDSAELILMGPAENAVRARLASDADHCSADRCEMREQGRCFFYRAREKAERAHVAIVNHALLLSDMATENHVLPEYKYLVGDEAHHLEEGATKAFSFDASRSTLELMLRGLAHERGGLLGTLAGALHNSDVPANIKRDTQNILNDVAQDVERASARWDGAHLRRVGRSRRFRGAESFRTRDRTRFGDAARE